MAGRHSPQIVVIGSVNMDLVVRVAHLPRAGETVCGRELLQIPGGKGANQAVAAARLGAAASLVGRVGDDGFGATLQAALVAAGVNVDQLQVVPDCSSGVALIHVEDSGENAITIVPGANGRWSGENVRALEPVIAAADAVLMQLEIPLDAVTAVLALARQHGVRSVLDAAPVPPGGLPESLYQVDLLSPNQTEAAELTGVTVQDIDSAARAAGLLRARGAPQVVVKLGALGAFWSDRNGQTGHVAADRVEVVDTTAAGDAFTAALVVALAEGQPLSSAVRFGCAAGTLATTNLGAQQSMPRRADVERALAAPRA